MIQIGMAHRDRHRRAKTADRPSRSAGPRRRTARLALVSPRRVQLEVPVEPYDDSLLDEIAAFRRRALDPFCWGLPW